MSNGALAGMVKAPFRVGAVLKEDVLLFLEAVGDFQPLPGGARIHGSDFYDQALYHGERGDHTPMKSWALGGGDEDVIRA